MDIALCHHGSYHHSKLNIDTIFLKRFYLLERVRVGAGGATEGEGDEREGIGEGMREQRLRHD